MIDVGTSLRLCYDVFLMADSTGSTIEIKDGADFKKQVLEAAADKTVVVDFWAEWCAPCKTLSPLLERVIQGLGNDIYLAKVDVEKNQSLAETFAIASIPNIKVFREGKIVEEFVGALPEAELKLRLAALVSSPADKLVVQARKLVEAGDIEKAERALREAVAEDQTHPRARLRLAELLLIDGNVNEARELAEGISEETGEYQAAKAVLGVIGFADECEKAGGAAAIKKKLKAKPKDLGLRYSLACCLAASGDYPGALDEFLAIVESDKDFRDEAAREAMVHIFALIGEGNPISIAYRKKLSQALY